MPTLVLALAIVVGFTVEATVGFGATLVVLSLGSLILPTEDVLVRVVPLNALLSLAIVVRARSHVDVRALFARILPAIALGMPLGLWLLHTLDRRHLQLALAVFVFALAVVELVSMARRARPSEPRPLSPLASFAILFFGGVAHGALATGGPPVVYVAARTLTDKFVFRATLSALWLLLNLALIAVYASDGRITVATLRDSAPLLPPVILGIAVGDFVHRRVPETLFRRVVFTLLLAVAVLLVAR